MMPTITRLAGTAEQVMTTALNSMANNALVLSAEITPTSLNYVEADIELYIASMGGTPTAYTGFGGWFILKVDGTNYSDGGTSVTPARNYDFFLPIRAVSTAQRLVIRGVSHPVGSYKILLKNDGTGQALASSGNILTIRPTTYQSA